MSFNDVEIVSLSAIGTNLMQNNYAKTSLNLNLVAASSFMALSYQ